MNKKFMMINIVIMFFAAGLSGCIDNTNSYAYGEKIIGSWGEDETGDIWIFYSTGGLNISGKNFSFEYWFDEDNYFWYSIKDDDFLQIKCSITYKNNDLVILDRVGVLMGGEYTPGNPKIIILDRIK